MQEIKCDCDTNRLKVRETLTYEFKVLQVNTLLNLENGQARVKVKQP